MDEEGDSVLLLVVAGISSELEDELEAEAEADGEEDEEDENDMVNVLLHVLVFVFFEDTLGLLLTTLLNTVPLDTDGDSDVSVDGVGFPVSVSVIVTLDDSSDVYVTHVTVETSMLDEGKKLSVTTDGVLLVTLPGGM